MTIKHLRELLHQISLMEDHREVFVWLPGSRIALSGVIFSDGKVFLIEGNVTPGSALEKD